jgi:hypothetical protein
LESSLDRGGRRRLVDGVSAAAGIAAMRQSSSWMPVSLSGLVAVLSECDLALVYVS